jgi:hypothetical protein
MFTRITAFAFVFLLAFSAAFAQSDGTLYYDKEHKDYHTWGPQERTNYTVYLGEKKIKVHTFKAAPASEKQDYWKWRHEHPDVKK